MDVFDTLRVIRDVHTIGAMSFHEYPKQSLIQDTHEFTENELLQVESAIAMKKSLGIPFWDALMLTFFDNKDASYRLLEWVQGHNKKTLSFNHSIDDIEKDVKLYNRTNISVCSRVKLKSQEVDLFFLDFHIPPSDGNLLVVCKVLSVLDVHGYILLSGESYHFIGTEYFENTTMLDLLTKALLFSPIVDKAWIVHQIIERSCSLRVSKKHDIIPYVVREV